MSEERKLHRTKSHVSAFLKCDGNIELHVSATFTFCGNVLCLVLMMLSSFCHVSGTEMSSHLSVILKSGKLTINVLPAATSNFLSLNNKFSINTNIYNCRT